MLMDDANALAEKLRDSDEYKTYLEAKPQNYDNFAKFLDKKLFEKA